MFKKYWVLFKVNLQATSEYRFDMAIWGLSAAITPFIGLAIWLTVSAGSADLIYSRSDFIIYFMTVAIVRIFTSAWGSWFISEQIVEGTFSKYLLKPLSTFDDNLMENLSEKILKIVLVIPIVAIICFLSANQLRGISFSFAQIVLFIISTVNGFIISLLLDQSIGLSAFWFHDVDFLNTSIGLLEELFTGALIPIVLLPGFLHTVAFVLPFRYMVSFPVEILLGKVYGGELLFGLGGQFIWLFLSVLAYRLIFRFGSRAYQGYGA